MSRRSMMRGGRNLAAQLEEKEKQAAAEAAATKAAAEVEVKPEKAKVVKASADLKPAAKKTWTSKTSTLKKD